jgi:hypothetical protein
MTGDIVRSKWCCGVGELGNFEGTLDDVEYDVTRVNVEDNEAGRFGFRSRGFIISFTSSQNKKDTISGLKANEFKVMTSFINPQTHRKVTMWGKKINQPSVKLEALVRE